MKRVARNPVAMVAVAVVAAPLLPTVAANPPMPSPAARPRVDARAAAAPLPAKQQLSYKKKDPAALATGSFIS